MAARAVVDRLGRLLGAAGLVWAGLTTGCAHSPVVSLTETTSPATSAAIATLLHDVNVVDGSGATGLAHQDVLLFEGKVRWIKPMNTGPTGSKPTATELGLPDDVEVVVIESAGRSVLPGYVDAHTHIAGQGRLPGAGEGLTMEGNLQRWLAAGVTTVFDMGGAGHEMTVVADRTRQGQLIGPRVFHTNLAITGEGSHPIPLADELMGVSGAVVSLVLPQVKTVEDIPRALDTVDEEVVDYVKIMVDRMPEGTPIMAPEVLTALVKAARARGHLVFVHAGAVDDAVIAAEAGATALAHLPWRGELTAEKAARLKASGVTVVTTASMWEDVTGALGGHPTTAGADVDAATADLIPADVRAGLVAPREASPKLAALEAELAANAEARKRALQALLDAEVPLVVGTDAVLPGIWPGSSYLREVTFLLERGVPVETLIPAMTSRPARLVAGPGVRFGFVRQGAAADLVLVDGDPFVTPTTLAAPICVWRQGRLVRRLNDDGTLRDSFCLPAWQKLQLRKERNADASASP